MIDEAYRNSFKEVYVIWENTESELLYKIPTNFINFIKDNMNNDYETNIDPSVDIDKQKLLNETEAILSLIYRSYWATDEERKEFEVQDQKDFIENEEKKKEEYPVKDIYQIFEERKNINKIAIDNNLMVIKKENFIKRFFKKILNIFQKR